MATTTLLHSIIQFGLRLWQRLNKHDARKRPPSRLTNRTASLRCAMRYWECRRAQTMLRSASDGLHILDASGRLVEASDVFMRMLGYQRAELIGQHNSRWWPDDADVSLPDMDDVDDWHEHDGVIGARFQHKDGSFLDVEITAQAIELNGQAHVSLTARDIRARKRATGQFSQLAYHDPLTGLPNRRLLQDQLAKTLAQARRHQRTFAIMFVDLDKFKHVNDTLGHEIGDELLKIVASRLQHCIRAEDIVARLGGDEFVVVLTEIADGCATTQIADKILNRLSEPVIVREHQLAISASIGISEFHGHHQNDIQTLLAQADAAMYRSKQLGGNGYHHASHDHAAAPLLFSNSLQS